MAPPRSLAAAAGDNNALYRLQYGITDETAEAPADEAPTDAADDNTADSTDPTTPAEDAESGETTTGTPMQTISLIPLEQVPLQGDEELLVVQMDVEPGHPGDPPGNLYGQCPVRHHLSG